MPQNHDNSSSLARQETGILLQMADGTITACNQAAQLILGMTLDQLQDTSSPNLFWHMIHPDGAPFPHQMHPVLLALQSAQPCLNVKMGFYKPDGDLVWVKLDAQPLFRCEEHTPYAVAVTITPFISPTKSVHLVGTTPACQRIQFPESAMSTVCNVKGIEATERMQLESEPDCGQIEARLHESESQYRVLAEAIPQLVWVTTSDGQNEYVNQRFCDFVGLTSSQLLSLDWLSIIHPDDRDRTRERWLASVKSGNSYEIEYRFRHFDGTYHWFLGQGVPFRDEQGQVVKWFGTCTNIGFQKQHEAESMRLIAEQQAAREAAERANRIKDELLAVVSHELRTPLNPILGWSKLLRMGKLTPERAAEALGTIERNAQQQAQLIDDLLDISRVLRNKLVLTVELIDLAGIVANALETIQLVAEAKSIHVEASLAVHVGAIRGDAGRLQQIVGNLLSNAVKFTPEGGRIQVQLTQRGGYAQLQVIDTGKGIAPEFLPHLFEAFRQEDNTTTRQFGGLGLGLAIVQELVELHGGTVRADSPGVGQGATFTVRLPIASAQLTNPAPALPNHQDGDLSGVRIFVVDDIQDSREFVAFVLQQAGAIVTMASSAQAALDQIREANPDVIISDIGMPDINGYELLQRIRQDFALSTRAIALTAYATENDQQQALESGFDRHLAKPIDPAALIEAVLVLAHSSLK
ncbi:ATP-binding protein [Leptolyngbya sp. FACHB-17]|uniref:PAS domain-containing hybrid sensor histidine kinase/response regulator n=1 Tax=unclassified Leptolyngbya TaxID=2650499 RepID=UPI0018EF7960|nr:ATP-binding protein [Leptolyngbya sp. FACHB-17]